MDIPREYPRPGAVSSAGSGQTATSSLSCCKNLPAGRNVVPALLLQRQLRDDVAVKSQGLRQQRDDVVVTGPPGPPGVTSRPRRQARARETASQPLPAGLPGHQDTAGTLKFLVLPASDNAGTSLVAARPRRAAPRGPTAAQPLSKINLPKRHCLDRT